MKIDKVDKARERLEKKYNVDIKYVPEGHIKYGMAYVGHVTKIELEEGLSYDKAIHVIAHEVAHHLHEEVGMNFYDGDEYPINLLADELIHRHLKDLFHGRLWNRSWIRQEYEGLGYDWPF